jgi:hypothetical protein
MRFAVYATLCALVAGGCQFIAGIDGYENGGGGGPPGVGGSDGGAGGGGGTGQGGGGQGGETPNEPDWLGEWMQPEAPATSEPRGVAVAGDDAYVIGHQEETVSFAGLGIPPGGAAAHIVRIGADGAATDAAWFVPQVGSATISLDAIDAIRTDMTTRVIVAGTFTGDFSIRLDGGTEVGTLSSAAGGNMFWLAFDTSLSIDWSETAGVTNDTSVTAIAPGPNGTAFIVGNTTASFTMGASCNASAPQGDAAVFMARINADDGSCAAQAILGQDSGAADHVTSRDAVVVDDTLLVVGDFRAKLYWGSQPNEELMSVTPSGFLARMSYDLAGDGAEKIDGGVSSKVTAIEANDDTIALTGTFRGTLGSLDSPGRVAVFVQTRGTNLATRDTLGFGSTEADQDPGPIVVASPDEGPTVVATAFACTGDIVLGQGSLLEDPTDESADLCMIGLEGSTSALLGVGRWGDQNAQRPNGMVLLAQGVFVTTGITTGQLSIPPDAALTSSGETASFIAGIIPNTMN